MIIIEIFIRVEDINWVTYKVDRLYDVVRFPLL